MVSVARPAMASRLGEKLFRPREKPGRTRHEPRSCQTQLHGPAQADGAAGLAQQRPPRASPHRTRTTHQIPNGEEAGDHPPEKKHRAAAKIQFTATARWRRVLLFCSVPLDDSPDARIFAVPSSRFSR